MTFEEKVSLTNNFLLLKRKCNLSHILKNLSFTLVQGYLCLDLAKVLNILYTRVCIIIHKY